MDILYSIGSFLAFGMAVAATLVIGIKLLPIAEVLFMEDLPEDSKNEA